MNNYILLLKNQVDAWGSDVDAWNQPPHFINKYETQFQDRLKTYEHNQSEFMTLNTYHNGEDLVSTFPQDLNNYLSWCSMPVLLPWQSWKPSLGRSHESCHGMLGSIGSIGSIGYDCYNQNSIYYG